MIDERYPDPRLGAPARRITPTQIALIVAVMLIVAFAAWTFASTRRSNPDKLPDANSTTVTKVAANPGKSCGSQATYDLIKRELFRRAAALRGNDQAAFGKLAGYSVVRVDRPLLDNADDRTGAVSCSGSLTLDLPPGVAVVGGRRTLSGDIGYALQPSADGNGQVLTLINADSIVTSLATIGRVSGATATDPLAPASSPTLQPPLSPVSAPILVPAPAAPPPPRMAPPSPPQAPNVASRPSFSCTSPRSRSELAVCGDSGLAALDRQMAAEFNDALRGADPETRMLLRDSGRRFLGYRDQCPSSACIAQTYRGRMREISDIASGRLR